MQDCFIEASAGTGKTYTIEQHVKHLVCDLGLKLEEILIVTFTNAATWELKERIRQTLSKQGIFLQTEESIYTIHGFCQKALQDFAFETHFPFEKVESDISFFKQLAKDCLAGDLSFLHPAQINLLFSLHRQDSDALASHLANLVAMRVPVDIGPTYQQIDDQIQLLLDPLDRQLLLEDLCQQAQNYKDFCDRQKKLKAERWVQLKALSEGHWIGFPLALFAEANKQQKQKDLFLHYPGFLEALRSFACQAQDPLQILASVVEHMRLKAEKLIAANEWVFFEDLIQQMKKQVHNPVFANALKKRYQAVIIDEFQDTDPDQWDIFSTLFLHHIPLFLVGDPKQAIYRFRRADIYTYLEAKKQISTIQTLSTNYRSSPSLVEELNKLFADLTFPLPKTREHLRYQPVQAGKEEEGINPPVVLLSADSEQELFQKVIQAILAHPTLTVAVLIKDRYQAERFAATCPFAVRLRKARSLLGSPALAWMEDILTVLVHPHDRHAVQRLLHGSLAFCTEKQLYHWRLMFEEKGLLGCFRHLLHDIGPHLMQQKQGEEIYQDLLHFAELLQTRKQSNLLDAFDALVKEDADSELLRGRLLADEHAVEVMTTHVSKGLEFDLVFPIGLALNPTKKRDLVYYNGKLTADEQAWQFHQQELDAELIRQLYVACTRAKKRLYLPIISGQDKAPIASLLVGKDIPEITEQPMQAPMPSIALTPPKFYQWHRPSVPIVSFTALANKTTGERKKSEIAFPAGPEVGVILHRIFENISFQKQITESLITPFIKTTVLEAYCEQVTTVVKQAVQTVFPGGFTLADIPAYHIQKEVAFLYPYEQGYCKGFIDLLFEHANKIYVVDWKSNVIEGTLQEEIDKHQYRLQAKLYKEAIVRQLKLLKQAQEVVVCFVFIRQQDNKIAVL